LAALEASVKAAVPGVVGIHHVHLWSVTPQERVMTLHAELTVGVDADSAIRGISRHLKTARGIGHVTVQVEREPCTKSDTSVLAH
jgi:cobalt-zinc-cadmium efflux system protein